MKEDKKQYQLTVVFNPKTEEKEKETFFGKLEDLLASLGSKSANKEKYGLKELSYKIKGNNKGEFWIYSIESDKALHFSDVELMLNRDASVIRYLLLKI